MSEQKPKPPESQEWWTLDEGRCVLSWPSELSAESVAEFEYWVAGLVRRARRRAGMGSSEETGPGFQREG